MPVDAIYLLAGCRSRRDRLRGRARDVLARADTALLARELRARRLLPLIGTRALEVCPELTGAPFGDAVQRALTVARAQGLAVEAATRTVAESLAQAGIPALPLKGPLLAMEAHGDIGLRETADVDVLVPRAALEAAVDVLTARGYRRPATPMPATRVPDLHVALTHSELPPVDVHWRVHWYETAFGADMLERATPRPDGLLRAQSEDLAAALLLFYARDGFHGVRLAADLAAWWDGHYRALSHGFLEDYPRRYPALAPALTAAAEAGERVTGTPARRWLGAAATECRRTAVAARFADWAQTGDRDQLAANVSLVGGLLGPPGSWGRFARRELLPAGATPAAAAAHAAKMCARYALGLWRVRRGRPWMRVPSAC